MRTVTHWELTSCLNKQILRVLSELPVTGRSPLDWGSRCFHSHVAGDPSLQGRYTASSGHCLLTFRRYTFVFTFQDCTMHEEKSTRFLRYIEKQTQGRLVTPANLCPQYFTAFSRYATTSTDRTGLRTMVKKILSLYDILHTPVSSLTKHLPSYWIWIRCTWRRCWRHLVRCNWKSWGPVSRGTRRISCGYNRQSRASAGLPEATHNSKICSPAGKANFCLISVCWLQTAQYLIIDKHQHMHFFTFNTVLV